MHFRSARRTGITFGLILILLTATMTSSVAQDLPPGGTFVDDNGNVHEGFIEAIAARNITRGCNPPANDRYCPTRSVTRGQMAAFLNRALTLPDTNRDFFDDDNGSPFEGDINRLAAAGITLGCNPPANDHFCPQRSVNRGQMAAFLVRGFGYTAGDGADLFVDDDGSPFERDIDRLATAGVTRGCNQPDIDHYCPHNPVRRDQMASFLARALRLRPIIPPPTHIDVAPYFFIDEAGHPNRTGPFLAPIHREVPYTTGTARAAIEQLLAGPNLDERTSTPEISTQVPAGTELLGLTITGGTATIDLSSQFNAGQTSAAAAMRVGQVVFTLSRFDSVSRVVFRQNGAAVAVQTGSGALVTRPVTRADYVPFQAAISVENPTYMGPGGNPLRVTGVGAVFEAQFEYVLTDNEGLIIAEGSAMTTSGVGFAPFGFNIFYEIDRPQRGALIVFAYSAENGSQIDIREYPVFLRPCQSPDCPINGS